MKKVLGLVGVSVLVIGLVATGIFVGMKQEANNNGVKAIVVQEF